MLAELQLCPWDQSMPWVPGVGTAEEGAPVREMLGQGVHCCARCDAMPRVHRSVSSGCSRTHITKGISSHRLLFAAPSTGVAPPGLVDAAAVASALRTDFGNMIGGPIAHLHGVIAELKEQVKTLHGVIPGLTEQVASLATEFEALRSQLADIQEYDKLKSENKKEAEGWQLQ